jgi:hypothetical protein
VGLTPDGGAARYGLNGWNSSRSVRRTVAASEAAW